jgi:hypothetical protein
VWPALLKEKNDFKAAAFSKKGDLATRIRKGAAWLEDLSKKFLRVAENQNVPISYALESYCVIPGLYQSFGNQVSDLGRKNAEVGAEIIKVSTPLYDKAAELADQCIAKSVEHGHNGEFYRYAVENWGWEKDAKLKSKAASVLARLEAHGPGLDPDPSNKTEEQLLESHLQNQESEETWYSLAIKRMKAGHAPLSRLTLVAGLTKWPTSGRTQLALGYVEEQEGADPTGLYRQAAKNGAPQAWIDLARYQLKRLQWEDARASLKEADLAGLFSGDPSFESLVGEMVR